jgi:hypothetical protein
MIQGDDSHTSPKIKTNLKNMKKIKALSFVMMSVMVLTTLLTGCESNPDVQSDKDILPQKLSVDIPNSLTIANSGGRINGRSQSDSIKGDDIYKHLGTFIAIGKQSSKLVEEIINGIRKHHIDRVLTLTFTSDDDGRIKNLVVTSDVTFEGAQWDYQLMVTDADSEDAADGGKALQIFWNNDAPIKGISIIKPYNCDRPKNQNAPDAMFRINYSEDGAAGYDSQMEVLITGLPINANEQFSVNNIHMFAGKKGEVVDVYGNSNHPNAVLFGDETGMNWAFVASGDKTKDVAIAEVGLPASSIDSNDRDILLKENSIKNVFEETILEIWPQIDPDALDSYLSEISAPGYFDHTGFIKGGTSPGADWDVLAERMNNLTPYNPKQVSELQVTFQ